MSKADIKLPEEFLLKISRLSNSDEAAQNVLKAGGEVMLEKVKSNLKSVIGRETKYPSRSTGELLSSLGLSPAMLDKDGNHNIKIGFAEPRKGGESNAEIAAVLEYGKSGQAAKPFIKTAKSSGKRQCISAMEDALKRETEKL